MITTIYIIILSYFVLGGVGFYLINRRKEKDVARKSWTKFIAYFFIIHILFFSILIDPLVFRGVAGLIVLVGLYELCKIFKKAGYAQKGFFLIALLIFGMVSRY